MNVISTLGAVLGLCLAAYFAGQNSIKTELSKLKGQLAQQQEQAEIELKKAQDQTRVLHEKAAQTLKNQEKKDREALSQINDLQRALASQPIRVRYQANRGSGGDCTADRADKNANAGAADRAEAHGLLPEANHRRLNAALVEIETLSAAYRSCRATLLNAQNHAQIQGVP